MEIDPNTYERSMYRTMSGLVIPRPIAWISSRGSDGEPNLAPFSFFNVVSIEPPRVVFAPSRRSGSLPDTAHNVRETEEFVVNVVTHEFAETMNMTSAEVPPSENEFDLADLEAVPATRIDAPRVAGIAGSFECTVYDVLDLGSNLLVIGDIVYVHVRDDVTTDGKVDVRKVDVLGRLSGSYYDRVTDRFMMDRPDR